MNDRERQGTATVFTLLTIVIVAALLYLLREVFVPLALATLLTFLLAPIVIFLQRWHLPRVPAVIVVVLAAFALIGSFGWVMTFQIYDLAKKMPAYRQNIQTKVKGFKGPQSEWLQRANKVFRETADEVSKPAEGEPAATGKTAQEKPIPVEVHAPQSTSLGMVKRVLGSAISPLATAGLVVVFVVFMLLQREDLRDRLIRLAGTGRMNVTTQAFDEAGHRVSRYLMMQLVVNIIYGIPVGIGLYFIGVPNPLLWGVLATVLRFVPYLGPTVGAALPLFVAFAVDPGWSMLLWAGGMFLTMELLSNNFIEPWLYGSSTGLSPVAIILAAVFWTWLWGPVGLLLSTPLTVCLAVLGRHVPRLSFLNVLLSNQPVLPVETRVYQRLLAGDLDEALEVVEDFLKEKPLVELYDTVLIPALTLAEADRHAGTLPDDRLEFLSRSIREIIEEFDDKDAPEGVQCKTSLQLRDGAAGARLLCVPARDEADELVGLMLTKLVCYRGFAARTLHGSALSADCIKEIARSGADVVMISAIPPAGFRQARYLCRRLRADFPNLKLFMGAWGMKEDLAQLKNRLGNCQPDSMVTTIKQALEQIISSTAIREEMVPAPVPATENQRIAELKKMELLDSPPDELFDNITQELSKTFDVPIALVNLVDDDRVFWKSQVGLPEDLATAKEAPRDTSFCGHVVAANEMVVVPDLHNDPRFANNPVVQERGLRFYAGAPLRTRKGNAIGTVCLMDTKPRQVSQAEKRYLQMIADRLIAEVESRAATPVPA